MRLDLNTRIYFNENNSAKNNSLNLKDHRKKLVSN